MTGGPSRLLQCSWACTWSLYIKDHSQNLHMSREWMWNQAYVGMREKLELEGIRVFRRISLELGKDFDRTNGCGNQAGPARQEPLLAETESRMSKVSWRQRGLLCWRQGDELREQLSDKSRMVGWGNPEEDLRRQDKDLEFCSAIRTRGNMHKRVVRGV